MAGNMLVEKQQVLEQELEQASSFLLFYFLFSILFLLSSSLFSLPLPLPLPDRVRCWGSRVPHSAVGGSRVAPGCVGAAAHRQLEGDCIRL